jgi:hypothetical protein
MDLPDCRRPSEPLPATMLELAAANAGTSVSGAKLANYSIVQRLLLLDP